ncbi:MAG: hypothetical protein AAGF12_43985 [Myxococcota bacterium]
MGIAAIICGVLSVLFMVGGFVATIVPVLGTVLSILSVVLAIAGIVCGGLEISRAGRDGRSNGLGIGGVITNVVALIPALLVAVTCGLCNACLSAASLAPLPDASVVDPTGPDLSSLAWTPLMPGPVGVEGTLGLDDALTYPHPIGFGVLSIPTAAHSVELEPDKVYILEARTPGYRGGVDAALYSGTGDVRQIEELEVLWEEDDADTLWVVFRNLGTQTAGVVLMVNPDSRTTPLPPELNYSVQVHEVPPERAPSRIRSMALGAAQLDQLEDEEERGVDETEEGASEGDEDRVDDEPASEATNP